MRAKKGMTASLGSDSISRVARLTLFRQDLRDLLAGCTPPPTTVSAPRRCFIDADAAKQHSDQLQGVHLIVAELRLHEE
ncbi:hypothetical protein KIPB_001409 [Kipferlia bialata]|uniref:Uncharacterized protein n=1 Tax=Kipferlia bialata TaxID=797122 RepID=A0A9K3CRY9_9EUKA|nr:hypothetical protein KIPB_001409 [Kipferlia bialata]|eukprot:g1409.t1